MSEAKKVEKLSYYAISIGLIYIVIGLLDGFWMVSLLMAEKSIPGLITSSHGHFLCMSTIILIIGVAMASWARLIRDGRAILTGGQLRSAQASIALLAIGNIVTFVSYSAQMIVPGLIGDIIYFVGFVMVTIGWILGLRKIE